jgi:hypothetical protein
MLEKIRYFIPLAFVITALSGLIYLTGQQNLRQGANDPQIQISEDIASRLSGSTTIPNIPATNAIDIGKSLNTFIIAYVRSHNQTRITWQPKEDVRSAVVITKFDGKSKGFVLVGRSLREVEEREENLSKMVGLGWIVMMFGTLITK